jgi:predicted neuraminidase
MRRIVPLLLMASAAGMCQAVDEFVFETAPFPSCHASTVVELKNGDLMAAWFGGAGEGRPDVAIWGATRTKDGWSAPRELVREPNVPTWNPVLFYKGDGKLWLYYKYGRSPETWTAGRRSSTDDGKTWSAVEHLPAGLYGPIRAKPLVLDNGTIVSGTSVESYGSWAAWVERSTDAGRTWTKFGPITVPGRAAPAREGAADGLIQPSVIRLGGQRLRLYARATPNIGKIAIADSNDLGVTWTQARTIDVPHPNSGIDAVALPDARVVLVYNHTTSGRTPLNLAISRDGERFQMFKTLAETPGEYSYPSMIVGRDGSLHITYTWQRKRIKYVRVPAAEIPK